MTLIKADMIVKADYVLKMDTDLTLIRDGAIAVKDKKIVFIGSSEDAAEIGRERDTNNVGKAIFNQSGG